MIIIITFTIIVIIPERYKNAHISIDNRDTINNK